MATYLSVTKNKIRQVWRRRSFWIIQGFLTLIPVLMTVLIFLSGARAAFSEVFVVPGVFTLSLYLLVLPILVGPAILEDFGKIGEILWSSPLDGLTHFTGVFSGLWLTLLSGSLLQLSGWFLADLFWTNFLTEWVWLYSLAIHLIVNTLGLGLTLLLAILVRRVLPLLIGWAALWVWAYFRVIFSEGLMEGFNPMHTTAYVNAFFHNLQLSPSLGLGLGRDQVLGMMAWFLGISLAALGLALLLSLLADRRRAVRRGWTIPLATVLSLLALGAGYTLNARAISAHAISPSPRNVQIDAWKVLSQRTEIEVNAARGSISGTAQLTLSPQKKLDLPEIVLRLNTGLTLKTAYDETGHALATSRQGDSLVISLPTIPTAPFTLTLAWEGKLHIPYTAYEMKWLHYDAGYPYGFTYIPQALKALLQPDGGFLLRDGDWMPWPWSTTSHQAGQNSLVIRPKGGDAVASVPMQDGVATWEGPLPEGLLVFLPGQRSQVDGMTLAASPRLGSQHMQQAAIFAAAAQQLASLFDESLPRYVVVTPYLPNLVWSSDLLLVPDGSGYYLSRPMEWLYQNDVNGPDQPLITRTTLASLARVWFINRLPPSPLEFQPVGSSTTAGEPARVLNKIANSEKAWEADNGHWVQSAEFLDVITTWNPRRQVELSPQGEWSALAFWLAMELADETTRQADLDLIAFFAGEGLKIRSGNQRAALMANLIWPDVLDTVQGRRLVWNLHNWATTVGQQKALTLLSVVLQETQPETVDQLIAELAQRSGHTIPEEQP